MANGNLGDTGMRWRFYGDMVDRDLAAIEAKADATIARINQKLGHVNAGNGSQGGGMPSSIGVNSSHTVPSQSGSNFISSAIGAGVGAGTGVGASHELLKRISIEGYNRWNANDVGSSLVKGGNSGGMGATNEATKTLLDAASKQGTYYSHDDILMNKKTFSGGGPSSYTTASAAKNQYAGGAIVGGGGGAEALHVFVVNWPGGNGSGGGGGGNPKVPNEGGDDDKDEGGIKGFLKKHSKAAAAAIAIKTISTVINTESERADRLQDAGQDDMKKALIHTQQNRKGLAGVVDPLGFGYGDALATLRYGSQERAQQQALYVRTEDERRMASYGGMAVAIQAGRGSAYSVSPYAAAFNSNETNYTQGSVTYSKNKEEQAKRVPGADFIKTEQEFNSQRRILMENKDTADKGTRSRMRLDQASLDASNEGKALANKLRPVAGYALTTSATAIAAAEEQNKQTNIFAANIKPKFDPRTGALDMSPYQDVANMRKMTTSQLTSAKLDVEGQKMDVLKNIYGGRPTEISGLQSVEAMKDISPESNQEALNALTKAIGSLETEIKKLKP